MKSQSLNHIVSSLVPLNLATPPTPEKFQAAFCELGKKEILLNDQTMIVRH